MSEYCTVWSGSVGTLNLGIPFLNHDTRSDNFAVTKVAL